MEKKFCNIKMLVQQCTLTSLCHESQLSGRYKGKSWNEQPLGIRQIFILYISISISIYKYWVLVMNQASCDMLRKKCYVTSLRSGVQIFTYLFPYSLLNTTSPMPGYGHFNTLRQNIINHRTFTFLRMFVIVSHMFLICSLVYYLPLPLIHDSGDCQIYSQLYPKWQKIA
jgi:hypothetical protein